MSEQSKAKAENDIIFSKSVKAGKRIYYIDVKQDRHQELYLSVTESKRIKDGNEDFMPVFEKHKIFLYREDFDNFAEAFLAAMDYAKRNAPARPHHSRADYYSESQRNDNAAIDPYNRDDYNADGAATSFHKAEHDYRFDIDF